MPIRNGGFRTVPKDFIQRYIMDVICERDRCRLPHMVRSAEAFKKAVYHDPVLKMCLSGALSELKEGDVLYNYEPQALFRLMSAICLLPPSFHNQSITGVPFYALFIDFLNTRYGQAFFAHPLTNIHLKNVFNDYQVMLTSKISTKYLTTDPDKGWFSEEAQKRANYE